MAKSTFVLRALKILGLPEILKLSEVLHAKQVPLKKAAGEELIVWDDDIEIAPKKHQKEAPEAKVLPFPKKTISDLEPLPEESNIESSEEDTSLMSSDLVLWQREVIRHNGGKTKLEAFKGYKKSTEIYVVKTHENEGKEKIRFASTNGVLINKKQA